MSDSPVDAQAQRSYSAQPSPLAAPAPVANGKLAYFSGLPAAIFVADPDGTNIEQLTDRRGTESKPAWSPNGELLAFTAPPTGPADPTASGDRHAVFVTRADGTDARQLTAAVAGEYQGPIGWAPDSERLAYATFSGDLVNGALGVVDLSSGEAQIIATLPYIGAPAWSPDGSRILFQALAGADEREYDLFVVDPQGQDLERLTDSPGFDIGASWSPDGHSILFDSERSGRRALWVMDRDGANQRQLSDDPERDEMSGHWSPDGTRIAFVSTRGKSSQICVMNADGSDVRTLAEGGPIWFWSPDGTLLAVYRRPAGGLDVIDPDTGELKPLLDGVGDEVDWQPLPLSAS